MSGVNYIQQTGIIHIFRTDSTAERKDLDGDWTCVRISKFLIFLGSNLLVSCA
jgi:hypothetical protein